MLPKTYPSQVLNSSLGSVGRFPCDGDIGHCWSLTLWFLLLRPDGLQRHCLCHSVTLLLFILSSVLTSPCLQPSVQLSPTTPPNTSTPSPTNSAHRQNTLTQSPKQLCSVCYKVDGTGAGEIAQQLRACGALVEGRDLVPSIHSKKFSHRSPSPGISDALHRPPQAPELTDT